MLAKLKTPFPQVVMCGDFNLPNANWDAPCIPQQARSDEQKMVEKVKELTDEYFLFQLISGPTQRSGNTLDLCFCNNPALLYDYKAITTIHSDHRILECKTRFSCNQSTPDPQTHRNPNPSDGPQAEFDKLNFFSEDVKWDDIIKELSEILWVDELKSLEPSQVLNKIVELCLKVCQKHVPERTSTTTDRKVSRIPRVRRILMRRRCKVNKQLSTVRSEPRKSKLENEAREIEKKLQQSYNEEEMHREDKAVGAIKTNPKYFFAYAKKFSSISSSIGPLADAAGNLVSCSSKMAEILSDQYSSVFSSPKDPLKEAEQYYPDNDFNQDPYLADIPFTRKDIKDAMNEIPLTASAGPDRIPAVLLKKCSEPLSQPLFILWRLSLDTSTIPEILKTANIIPIHKGKGSSRIHAKNYRPIALTSHLTKVFEKVMRKYIVKFMDRHNLFNPSQHGFRCGRSCLSQLISHYEHILQLIEEGFDVDVIYLDFAKAFDKVDFDIILKKLRSLGVKHRIGRWIHAFITGRTQSVLVNGARSKPASVKSGVPQGSVLGPLLFLILIGDIDKDIASSFLSSFADDTRMGQGVNTQDDAERFQSDLDSVYQWTIDNNMELHGDKFEHLHYSFRQPQSSTSHAYISSSGTNIEEKSSVDKDLGVTMSNDGTFKTHIKGVVSGARSQASWVLRTFKTREKLPMMTLYKSLIQCKLDYCSQLWSPTSKGEINSLEMVQRNFLRNIKSIGRLPYWEQLKELGLYSQERRRERYTIIYIWRILEGQVPNISAEGSRGFVGENISHRLNCENSRLGRRCAIPPLLTSCSPHIQKLREASISVRGPRLFNSLPKHLRDMRDCSKDAFKSALDKYLRTIPDEPQIQGYTASRRADSNSLLQMQRFSYTEDNKSKPRVEVVQSASGGCADDIAVSR